jgi:hemerythrin superfamily protein
MTAVNSAEDVVAFLKQQHEQVKSLFAQVESSRGEQRQEAFTHLRRLLAVHETAEEEVVHPKARSVVSGGEEIVDARLQEENEAKKMLSQLESLDVDSAEFDEMLQSFKSDVVAHAEAEEREEFSRLEAELDDDQLQRMRRAAELAESTAPTHPHAGVESRSANLAAGPFAAMLDRARDVITGKH